MADLSPRTYVPAPNAVAIPQTLGLLRPDLSPGTDEYQRAFGRMAESRREIGPWAWDLVNTLRPPWNPVEQLLWEQTLAPQREDESNEEKAARRESLILEIEERAAELVTWPLMSYVRHWLEDCIGGYADALKLTHHWHGPSSARDDDETDEIQSAIKNAIIRMQKSSGLWNQELQAVFESVERFRAARSLPTPEAGKWQHQSAIMLTLDILGKTAEHWKACEEISWNSANDPRYTHFEPAVQLFWEWVQQAVLPNKLQALLGQEFAVARNEIEQRDARRAESQSPSGTSIDSSVTMNVRGPVTIHQSHSSHEDTMSQAEESGIDPFDIEDRKAEAARIARAEAAERQQRKDEFDHAVEAVRSYSSRMTLCEPDTRSLLADRLMALAKLCNTFKVPGQISSLPEKPPGVDCGKIIFQAALDGDRDKVLMLLERASKFIPKTQITLTNFLPNAGWMLWYGTSGERDTPDGRWHGDAGRFPGGDELDPRWLDCMAFDGTPVISGDLDSTEDAEAQPVLDELPGSPDVSDVEPPSLPKGASAILSLGEATYGTPGSRPISVSGDEDTVLQSFLENPAMDLGTLKSKTGLARPDKVLRGLTTKYEAAFATFINMPGGKGRGGYAVRIRREQ